MTNYKKISPVEAKKIMDTDNKIIIVDVRTIEEFEDGHIFNSICIPLDEIDKKAEGILTNKNQKILVYCRSGKRSLEACHKLLNLGYEDILDFGGIIDWNFEVVY